MADCFEERIERLREAQRDPGAMALIALDFTLDSQPDTERSQLRAAIEAAAVPHWFDAHILARLLELPESRASELIGKLDSFPIVERFAAHGTDGRNIHETTRLALRRELLFRDRDRLKTLSAHAIEAIGTGSEPHLATERLYHRFCASPEQAADDCEALSREWLSTARAEILQTLRVALEELENTELISGRPRAEVLLFIGSLRSLNGETAKLRELASTALELAKTDGYATTTARALSLLGEVEVALGGLCIGQARYEEGLQISGRLAQLDPANAGWQRDVATAHSNVGNALQAQGRLDDALAAFRKALEISERVGTARSR